MHRLPLYVIIDCGCNMTIPLLSRVKESISVLLDDALNDPFALELLWMSCIAVGHQFEIVKPLRPFDEIKDVIVRQSKNWADTETFEIEMIKRFSDEVISRRTPTQRTDFSPRILWFSDGSHRTFVEKCSNPYHWKRHGCWAWFYEINCGDENFVSKLRQSRFGSRFWDIRDDYEDLPNEEDFIHHQPAQCDPLDFIII